MRKIFFAIILAIPEILGVLSLIVCLTNNPAPIVLPIVSLVCFLAFFLVAAFHPIGRGLFAFIIIPSIVISIVISIFINPWFSSLLVCFLLLYTAGMIFIVVNRISSSARKKTAA